MNLFDFQSILSEEWLGGNMEVAGILIFMAALVIVLAVTKNLSAALIVALPLTFVFNLLGILSGDVTILLLIVTVLLLAIKTRDIWN